VVNSRLNVGPVMHAGEGFVRVVDWDKIAHAFQMGTIFSQKIQRPQKGFEELWGILTYSIFSILALYMRGKG
jgi:hypothetical protein